MEIKLAYLRFYFKSKMSYFIFNDPLKGTKIILSKFFFIGAATSKIENKFYILSNIQKNILQLYYLKL